MQASVYALVTTFVVRAVVKMFTASEGSTWQ
jgi:hypothetical protein